MFRLIVSFFKLDFITILSSFFGDNNSYSHFVCTSYATKDFIKFRKNTYNYAAASVVTTLAQTDVIVRVVRTISYSFSHCPFSTIHFCTKKNHNIVAVLRLISLFSQIDPGIFYNKTLILARWKTSLESLFTFSLLSLTCDGTLERTYVFASHNRLYSLVCCYDLYLKYVIKMFFSGRIINRYSFLYFFFYPNNKANKMGQKSSLKYYGPAHVRFLFN